MTIFLVGGTGAVGRRLVPLLVADGHRVLVTTTSPAKRDGLRAAGAEAIVLDALDREAVLAAVTAARPDVIVHQSTALPRMLNLKRFDDEFAVTNRLRTEGTRHLLDAARAVGVSRFVAQSYTGWPNAREGGRVKTEADPLDAHPPSTMRRALDAIRQLETLVPSATGLTGVVLRYGSFYGPGTSLGADGDIVTVVRKRMFPIVGDGAGVWSFVHIDDVAQATRLAIVRAPAGIFNIVDDDPAEVSEWLPELARAVGAKPPRRVPVWLGRLFIGDAGVSAMTRVRGSSNELAKRVLGWQLRYPSWREGFHRGLS